MALTTCAECAKEISDKAAACPHCGAPVRGEEPNIPTAPPSAEKSGGWWKWVIGIPVAGFALLMVIGTATDSPERKQRFSEADAIKLCWGEQGRKSLAPGTARFVAGACEKMEQDFRAKWGRNP